MATSVIAYTNSPLKAKFVQASTGMMLWTSGCPANVANNMSQLGITQTATSLRAHIDDIRTSHDKQIQDLKSALEVNVRVMPAPNR